jgi:hypothetical protein
MALVFLGKDPDSGTNNSPTVWDDGDCLVIQGWKLDEVTRAEVGEVPAHEAVVRIPKRMLQFFPGVARS